METVVSEQPKIISVKFPFSESPHINDRIEFTSLRSAQEHLRIASMLCPKDMLGYYKTDFVIEWSDGDVYKGRIDITCTHYNLKDHVQKLFPEIQLCD